MATVNCLSSPSSPYQFIRPQARNEIWIAEDSNDVRIFLKRAFKRTAPTLDLVFFRNGAELVEHFHAHPALPRLLLLDMEMPVMNGLEALRGMHAKDSCGGMPVVMFSSLENPEMIRKAYFCGAKLYLKKPVRLEDFSDVAELCTNCAEQLRTFPTSAFPFGALEAKNVLELVLAPHS